MNMDAFPVRFALAAFVAATLVGGVFYANQRIDPFAPRAAEASAPSTLAITPQPKTWSSDAPAAPAPQPAALAPPRAQSSEDQRAARELEKTRERARQAKEKQEAARRVEPLKAALPAPVSAIVEQGATSELMSTTAPIVAIRPPQSRPARLNPINAAAAAIYFPERARARGIGGQAVVDCAISAAGVVSDCRVVLEEPRQMGFGAAAARIAREGGGRPASLDGEPVDGGRAQRTVTFQP